MRTAEETTLQNGNLKVGEILCLFDSVVFKYSENLWTLNIKNSQFNENKCSQISLNKPEITSYA